ncbi:uncharacterized protein LOC127081880 [Lathyrus oleraceus]|uniref:uncharacterized protein LOC127081880 n=1 Tax=Pisum sativum TaxID=3888 RepID=UPI0021D16D79|nr:uncharacterized protein LOC127081880 [Pisum sativum]
MYLDYLIVEEMHFNSYVDHSQMQPFDEIMLYSRWLTCKLCVTAPHLPECVMWQFGYTQTIPRHHVIFVPPTLTRIQVDDMFDDYESHLVPEEAHSIIAVNDWSYVEGYIIWFFRMSHPYMVYAAPGVPSRPAH